MEDPVEIYLNLNDWGEDGPDEQYGSQSGLEETFMVGFIIVNIVGLKHYRGVINGREMVGLVREPCNSYDPNAIKVLNMRSEQVGYIERSSAAVLSPLIDRRLIIVEGIVPRGLKSSYKMPCQIHIFTGFEFIETVRNLVSEGGLQIVDQSGPGFTLSEAEVIKERTKGSEIASVDEIFSSVTTEKMVKIIDPPEIITSALFQHQKEGLGWLVHRENSLELPPFWEEEAGTFKNILTNFQTNERPEPLRGGILADDMGLGKTLTLISLIALNRPGAVLPQLVDIGDADSVESSSVDAAKMGKTTKPCKHVGVSRKKRKRDGEIVDGLTNVNGHGRGKEIIYELPSICGPKTTLVVCPPSVISTWISQLEEHTKHSSLKVYLYHGERTRKANELLEFDIVLTTYSTLAAELDIPKSPIKEIEWLRIILDEAHLVKNASAKQTKAVIALQAKRRWAATGTPIQNSSFDLFALMAFLRFEPFSIKNYWQSLVQRPLDQGSKNGLSRLQALMGTISLRRTKDTQTGIKGSVVLPPKTIEICSVELSMEERELYDKMENDAQNVVKQYILSGTVLRNYSTVLHIILRLRQICNDAALCPPDISSLLPSISLEDVSRNPDLLKKMLSTLQDGDDFDCPVCLSPPSRAIITCCTHIFCRACILRILKRPNPRCPMCRHPLTESDLFSTPVEDDNLASSTSSKGISSKVSVLLKLLTATRDKNTCTKSVVFSQFRKMLILLEKPLRDAGFVTLMLDGSMPAKKRAQVIKEFGVSGPGAPTVLLASLKAAGAGINLTAASRVYLMEPWWNPAVEDQAMDRVHRIGQTEDVKVVRMIVENSIEERIVKLQEKKRNLAKGVFGRRGGKEQEQMRVEDLRTMMSL